MMSYDDYLKKLPLKYYDFADDLELFPEAVVYIVISSRGRGKTYSALLMAFGITGNWSKIAIIDTENGSADLYENLGESLQF